MEEINKKVTLKDGRSWWLKLLPEELAENVVLAIELDMPKACLLPLLDTYEEVSNFGEYQVYTGTFRGEPLSVVYHGSGSFSVSVAIEEIASLGAKRILRLGSCGGMGGDVHVGDVICAEGTIRDDRIMLDYVPAEFPAVADSTLLNHLTAACEETKLHAVRGITLSTATFYPGSGYETAAGVIDPAPYSRIKMWQKLDTKAVDVETSTVLIMARLFHMQGASLLCASNHVVTGEGGYLTEEDVTNVARAGFTAVTAK